MSLTIVSNGDFVTIIVITFEMMIMCNNDTNDICLVNEFYHIFDVITKIITIFTVCFHIFHSLCCVIYLFICYGY